MLNNIIFYYNSIRGILFAILKQYWNMAMLDLVFHGYCIPQNFESEKTKYR